MTSGFRALVVDDDDLSRDIAVGILKRLGATEIAEAADGATALAWADADAGNLDLIVCDLRMPQIDGMETLDGLALRTRPAMFVLASGADPRLLRAAAGSAARSGIDKLRVVSKPLTLDKMEAVVAAMRDARPIGERRWEGQTFTPPDCSTKIVRGLTHGEFIPSFQPKLDVVSQCVRGAEAHLRWLNPTYGLLAPESFIGVAQSTGLLGDLFFAILPWVVTHCAEWRRNGHDFGVSIDIPVPLLASRDLPRRLDDFVTAYGLSPNHITLEVTEDAWFHEQDLAREVLTRLRIRGFGLAIDDFGTGYSTVKQLLDAPFNEMKIDQGFVHAAPEDPETAIALSSCVTLARQLDLTVVANGVETSAQWQSAAEAGCHHVQGHCVAPPMPADEFARWIVEQASPNAAVSQPFRCVDSMARA